VALAARAYEAEGADDAVGAAVDITDHDRRAQRASTTWCGARGGASSRGAARSRGRRPVARGRRSWQHAAARGARDKVSVKLRAALGAGVARPTPAAASARKCSRRLAPTRRQAGEGWEIVIPGGRATPTGRDAVAWAARVRAARRPAKILLTCVDRDAAGTGLRPGAGGKQVARAVAGAGRGVGRGPARPSIWSMRSRPAPTPCWSRACSTDGGFTGVVRSQGRDRRAAGIPGARDCLLRIRQE
jgi:hypothetical protein